MIFFEQIISPFIFIIKQIFLFSYELTGDYGVAIILLSFVVSLILLPIFILIEKSKKKDDIVKKKMKPLIDEIKRVYKGQERYYYLKTINRQHNYNSFKALIPILSLLIQIPFFIAAYQFLENFEGLKGTSFLFIKDLSLPDGLFGDIHFLPILMTLVNLLTAYLYTRNGNTSERKQMLIVAGAFLILLFNLPSGLVLYWTMNNVFSFFRLFITNKEVFKANLFGSSNFNFDFKSSYKKLRIIFIVILAPLLFSQLYWAFNHDFNDIYIRLLVTVPISVGLTFFVWLIINIYRHYKQALYNIQVKPNLFFTLLFLTVYFHLSSQFYFTGENATLSIIALLMLIPIQFIGYIYTIRTKSKKIAYKFTIIIYSLIVAYQLITITSYFAEDISFSVAKINIFIKPGSFSDVLVSGIIFSLIASIYFFRSSKIKFENNNRSNYFIYTLSIIFIFGLIFFWKPLLVYSSSPDTFSFPAGHIFKYNYKLFLIWFSILVLAYILLPKKYKKILLYLSLIYVVISFIYSLIIPIQLGSLQVSKFSEQKNLEAPIMHYLLEAILLICIFFAVNWVYKKKYYKVTAIVLIVFNFLLIGQSIFSAYKTGYFYRSVYEEKINTKDIPFSKDQQNIVYFLADGFQGWYIKRIMEEESELKDVFSGFTWFPNTLSESNYTHSSVNSLFIGKKGSVIQMNADTIHTIKEKINYAALAFIKKIREKGYTYSSTYMHYSGVEASEFDNYIPFWNDVWNKWSIDVPLGNKIDVWKKRLYENALFYSLPLFLKPKIYNKTEWLQYYFPNLEGKKQDGYKYSYEPYNFIRLLPYISVIDSGIPNFVYIHDHSLHNPWNTVNDLGEMKNDVHPYEVSIWFIQRFARWIKWMKDNDVYDNTKIVIVSDHGVSWSAFDGEVDIKSSVNWENNPSKISKILFWRLNALLMVKDFNATGPLKEDWRIMTNADAPELIFNFKEFIDNDSINRILNSYYTKWEGEMTSKIIINIPKQYEVENDIYDLNNWKEIKEVK